MSVPEERLCVALDYPSRGEVLAAALRFSGRAGWLKVGLEAFVTGGLSLVKEVAATGAHVFLDLKFHDIPRTVAGAVAAVAHSGAAMVNVHAAGGRAMLEAAREAAATNGGIRLVAVTLLTSLDLAALSDLPFAGHPEGIARRLALLSKECGLEGVVCSADELPAIRAACGRDFFTVVPGIRLAGGEAHDQKRVATAAVALQAGADLLVVGRPITAANDPDSALDRVLGEMQSTPL